MAQSPPSKTEAVEGGLVAFLGLWKQEFCILMYSQEVFGNENASVEGGLPTSLI